MPFAAAMGLEVWICRLERCGCEMVMVGEYWSTCTSLMHFDDQLAAGRNDLHRNGSVHVLEAIM